MLFPHVILHQNEPGRLLEMQTRGLTADFMRQTVRRGIHSFLVPLLVGIQEIPGVILDVVRQVLRAGLAFGNH